MITPLKGNIVVEYSEEEWADNGSGIILPSQKEMREMMKKNDRYRLSADNKPPDLYRWGKYITGESRENIPEGSFVYYNRHDGYQFEHEGQTYLVLPENLALAYYVAQ